MEAVNLENPDRHEAVQQVLFETLCQQYQSLATFIQKLPLHPDMKSKVAFFMDSGFLWAKEAFMLANVQEKAALAAVEKDAAADSAVPDNALPNE
jgi:hypothetical protein